MQKELTLNDLQPSLQTSKQMSRHYKEYSTPELVENLLQLRSKGNPVFELRQIQMKRTRKVQMAGRGIHIARVRMITPYILDGDTLYPELVIKNSYDGSSPLVVEMGIYRQVCTNGLCVKHKDLGEIKIRHMKTAFEAVIDMVRGFAANLPKFIELQQKMVATTLNEVQITDFAKKATKLRWDKVSENADFEMITNSVRPEDEGNSLWKVYNVVQEKLMLGGVKLEGMKRTGKKIANAAEDLRINQELFELAMEYASSNEGERIELVQEDIEAEAVLN